MICLCMIINAWNENYRKNKCWNKLVVLLNIFILFKNIMAWLCHASTHSRSMVTCIREAQEQPISTSACCPNHVPFRLEVLPDPWIRQFRLCILYWGRSLFCVHVIRFLAGLEMPSLSSPLFQYSFPSIPHPNLIPLITIPNPYLP